MTIIVNYPNIKIEKVLSTYSGKAHKCMCGCSGSYHYSSSLVTIAAKDRGYEIDKEEINDIRVKQIVKKISNSPRVEVIEVDTKYIYSIIENQRQYVVNVLK